MTKQDKIEAGGLYGAMALAFAEIEKATKSANNPHFKSKYADLSAVIDAVKPALIKHGLFFTQSPHPTESGISVETMIHHANGESMSLGTLFVPADRNNAQGYGSALTYARRYGLMTAFGVPAEDDDGNAAAAAPPQERRAATPQQVNDIEKLAAPAGKTIQTICEAYKVSELGELTDVQATNVIARLRKDAASA